MFKAIKRGMNAIIRNSTNNKTIYNSLAKSSSAVNKYTSYLAKNSRGKSIPVGRAQSTIGKLYDAPGAVSRKVDEFKQAHKTMGKVMTGVGNFSRAATMTGSILLGTAGMVSVSMMSGAISKAQDIAAERYMRDSRYSSRVLAQSNLGKSSGMSSLNIGNHSGLSLAMHHGRHG